MGYRKAADGVATKGKTKGVMLAKGGKVKKMRMGGETTSMMDRKAEKAGRKVTKDLEYDDKMDRMMKKGGAVKKMRSGGKACK